MVKIGRNAPCPCGSGKKYKDCCSSNVVSLEHVLDTEIKDAMVDMIGYAQAEFSEEVDDLVQAFLEEFPDLLEVDEGRTNFYIFQAMNWAIFTFPFHGRTIAESYFSTQVKKWKRQSTRDRILKWAEAAPGLLEVVGLDGRKVLGKHVLTEQTEEIYLMEDDELPEIGAYILGILVPYGQSSTFFGTYTGILPEDAPGLLSIVQSLYEENEETDFATWLDKYYPLVLFSSLVETGFNLEDILENYEWDDAKQKEVLSILSDHLKSEQYPDDYMNTAAILWITYCSETHPKIRNAKRYAAAIHFHLVNALDDDFFTQKEIAEIYGISSSSLSTIIREMEEVLAYTLMAIEDDLDEDVFDRFDDDEMDADEFTRQFLEEMFDDDGLDEEELDKKVSDEEMLKIFGDAEKDGDKKS